MTARTTADTIVEAKALVKRLHQAQDAMGPCSDGYCVVKRPKGMHTNGGCKCMYRPDHITAQRAGHIMRLAQDMDIAIRDLLAVVEATLPIKENDNDA